MIFVTGAIGSGKRTFVRSLGYGPDEFACVSDDGSLLVGPWGAAVPLAPAPDSPSEAVAPVVAGVELLARGGMPAESAARLLATRDVLIYTEVGAGVVPLDPGERAWRERAGRLACALASEASCVVRMVCGIPQVISGELPRPRAAGAGSGAPRAEGGRRLELVILRHGRTAGNDLHRYVGRGDEPLTEEGEEQARRAGACEGVPVVYVSPMLRARQTARICFPRARQVCVPGLREMDFGDFEGRSADDMVDDASYRAWVDGNCVGRCPNGESRADLVRRTSEAVEGLAREAASRGEERAVIVAHGGTVMAAMSAFVDGPAGVSDPLAYFRWQVGNCEGYRVEARIVGGRLAFGRHERFSDLSFLR